MASRGARTRRPVAAWLIAIACLAGCSASVPTTIPGAEASPLTSIAAPAAPSAPAVSATAAAPAIGSPEPSPAAIPAVPVVATKAPAPSQAPAPTQPSTPVPTAAPPGDPQAPAGQGKEVLGFFLPGQMDYVLHTSDLSVLSTIAFFGISANKTGSLHRTSHGTVTDWRWKAWTGSKMSQIIAKAHAAGTKVVLTVTRFSWTSNTYDTTVQMLSSSANRARLARETAQAVVDRGVDGVNVDFEPIPISQKENFVDFVRRLRTELDSRKRGLELTVDSTGFIANYDVAGLTAKGAADAIFIMAYHYTGSWSTHAGSVSPLHRSSYDVTDTVNTFLRYTTPDKIMLGLPYYGNTWATYTDKLGSRTRPAGSQYGFPGSVVYSTAVGIAAAHGVLWDDVEKVPWTRWQARACSTCPLSWHQLYYEDAQSLKLKHELVIADGLRGTGIWTLGFGGAGPELNNELRSSFGSH